MTTGIVIANGVTLVTVGTASTPVTSVLTQSVWHFDSVSGNDTNTGLTLGASLKTWAGYIARVGLNPYINIVVDYYIHNDMPVSDPMLINGTLGLSGALQFHGVPTIVRSGTLSAVTARSPSANQSDEFTDGSRDWTSDVGKLVEVTTGAANGPTRSWVAKGLTTPFRSRMSMLSQRDPTNPFFVNIGPATTSQAYNVLRLPVVSLLYVNNSMVPNVNCFMELLDFPNNISDVTGPLWSFYDCSFDNLTVWFQGFFFNCKFTTGLTVVSQTSTVMGLMLNCVGQLSSEWISNGLFMQASQIATGQGNLSGGTFANHHASYGLGVYDADTPLLFGASVAAYMSGTVYGTGNTTCVMHLKQGSNVKCGNPYTVVVFYATSTGVDFKINNQTSLPAVAIANPYGYTADRTLTFAHLNATVAAGGFQGRVFDPADPGTGISCGDGT